MHPTSVFYNREKVLDKGDILCFTKLLETNRAYLTHSLKIKSLQSLLLFSSCIDTTTDFRKVIIDDWLELAFPNPTLGERVILIAHQLRVMLRNLLKAKLSGVNTTQFVGFASAVKTETPALIQPGMPSVVAKMIERETDPSMNTSELELGAKLGDFLQLDLKYTLSRLKKSEAEGIFFWTETTPTETETEVSKVKGGIHISAELRYGSVKLHKDDTSGASQHVTKHWTCTTCQQSYYYNLDEMVEHKKSCASERHALAALDRVTEMHLEPLNQEVPPPDDTDLAEAPAFVPRKNYHCPECQQDFVLTAIEILRHRENHKAKRRKLDDPE